MTRLISSLSAMTVLLGVLVLGASSAGAAGTCTDTISKLPTVITALGIYVLGRGSVVMPRAINYTSGIPSCFNASENVVF